MDSTGVKYWSNFQGHVRVVHSIVREETSLASSWLSQCLDSSN